MRHAFPRAAIPRCRQGASQTGRSPWHSSMTDSRWRHAGRLGAKWLMASNVLCLKVSGRRSRRPPCARIDPSATTIRLGIVPLSEDANGTMRSYLACVCNERFKTTGFRWIESRLPHIQLPLAARVTHRGECLHRPNHARQGIQAAIGCEVAFAARSGSRSCLARWRTTGTTTPSPARRYARRWLAGSV